MKLPWSPAPIGNVAKKALQRAQVLKSEQQRCDPSGSLVFFTEGMKGVALREKPTPDEELTQWSMGNPKEIAPSHVLWGRLKWELQLFFALQNLTKTTLSVYDFHAHTYEVSGREMPLAMMIHRARVDLCQDNSMFSNDSVLHLEPGEVQHVKLVLETSLFDTLMTTIIFGIFADYHQVQDGRAQRARIPSDKLYVFQHWHDWGDEKCHLVARDSASIQTRLSENSNDEALKKFSEKLEKHYGEHLKLGGTKPRPGSTPTVETGPGATEPRPQLEGRHGKQQTQIKLSVVDAKMEIAGKLIRVLSFLDDHPIPKWLMAEAFYQLSLERYDTLRKEIKNDSGLYFKMVKMKDGACSRDQAISHLLQEGALESAGQDAFRLSDSVRLSVVNQMPRDQQSYWLEYTLRAVDAAIPNPNRFRQEFYRQIGPHASSCLLHMRRLDETSLAAVGFAMNMSDCLCKIQLFAEAEPFCEYALDAVRRLPQAGAKLVATFQLSYAEVLRLQKKFDRAEPLLKKTRDSLAEIEGQGGVDEAIATHNLGAVYRDTGRLAEAAEMFDRAWAVFEKRLSPNSHMLPEILEDHARLHSTTGQAQKATAARERAAALRLEQDPDGEPKDHEELDE